MVRGDQLASISQLIFFGDSLTQRGWSYDGGWLALIADNFVRRADVIGRGYSGYNTRMCRQILPDLFPTSDSLSRCRLFTVFLGANDASTAEQHVPVEEYKDNLTVMIQHLRKLNLSTDRLLLISLPPIDETKWGALQISQNAPLNRELKLCPVYAEACQQVAKEQGVCFLNLYASMIAQQNWREYFSDGLHFARSGAEFLASLLNSVITERLEDCPLVYPDWKDVDKANPVKTFDAYKRLAQAIADCNMTVGANHHT